MPKTSPVPSIGPFVRWLAPSALLAALLVKVSATIAPSFGVQMSCWGCSLAYLYYVLSRATFVHVYVKSRLSLTQTGDFREAERAFGVGPQLRFILPSAILVVVCALADVALRGAGAHARDTFESYILVASGLVWLTLAPFFLLMWAGWAKGEDRSAWDSFTSTLASTNRVFAPWVAVAVGLSSISYILLLAYPLLSGLVVGLVPIGKALVLLNVLYMACIVALQVCVQAAFATWMYSHLELERGATNRIEDARVAVTADQRFARFGIATPRVDNKESPTQVAIVCWIMRILGAWLILFATWMCYSVVTEVSLDAAIQSSRPVCSWSDGHSGLFEVDCGEKKRLVSADKQLADAIELTLAYRTPSGVDATFRQIVDRDRGLALARAGHAQIVYHSGRSKPAVIPNGSSTPLLLMSPFFGLMGLLIFLGPTFVKRRDGTARMSSAAPAEPVRKFEVGAFISIFILAIAVIVMFPAIVPFVKLFVGAGIVIWALLRRQIRRRRS